ncbi:MAG: hypothetical protein LQ346_005323 [Caloplaca aetnensis]|nr:MAG: hypothetical protein LQ346_005323 [Caloplaca aetnensis]
MSIKSPISKSSSTSKPIFAAMVAKGMTIADLIKWTDSDEAKQAVEDAHPITTPEIPLSMFPTSQEPARYDSPPPELEQLEVASAAGDVATVKSIMDSWANKPAEEQHWKGAFSRGLKPALEAGHVAVAASLLEHGVKIDYGNFWSAMQHKSYPFLELYLAHGYDINNNNNDGFGFGFDPTPLADTLGDETMLRWFLDHGADPNAEKIGRYGYPMGETTLSKSMWKAPFSTIKLLFERGGPDSIKSGSLLWYAVNRLLPDRLEVIEYLLERGAASDLTRLLYYDRAEAARQADWVVGRGTPLHAAAHEGTLDIVKLFVDWGADPAIRDSKDRLAIDEARKQLEVKGDVKFQSVIDYLSAISNPAAVPPSEVGPTGLERL